MNRLTPEGSPPTVGHKEGDVSVIASDNLSI